MKLKTIAQSLVATAFVFAVLTTTSAEPGNWYASADVGVSDYQFSDFTSSGLTILDDSDTAWGVNLGYEFNTYLDVEIGYADLGSYAGLDSACPPEFVCAAIVLGNPINADLKAMTLTAVPKWQLNDIVSLVGRIGLMRWDMEANSFTSASDTDFLIGAGARFRLNNQISIEVSGEKVDDLEVGSVGIRWSF